MKAAFATDDFETITGHVGRCNGFMIFKAEGEIFMFEENRDNTFTNHGKGNHQHHEEHEHEQGHQQGAHSKIVNGLIDCDYLVFNHGGFRLIEDLKNSGIQPILTSLTDPKIAMQQLINGTLENNEDLTCNHQH